MLMQLIQGTFIQRLTRGEGWVAPMWQAYMFRPEGMKIDRLFSTVTPYSTASPRT